MRTEKCEVCLTGSSAKMLSKELVFTARRLSHPEIYYYKTRTGREVDFIIPTRGGPPTLVQVCESLAEPQTRKRETVALSESME